MKCFISALIMGASATQEDLKSLLAMMQDQGLALTGDMLALKDKIECQLAPGLPATVPSREQAPINLQNEEKTEPVPVSSTASKRVMKRMARLEEAAPKFTSEKAAPKYAMKDCEFEKIINLNGACYEMNVKNPDKYTTKNLKDALQIIGDNPSGEYFEVTRDFKIPELLASQMREHGLVDCKVTMCNKGPKYIVYDTNKVQELVKDQWVNTKGDLYVYDIRKLLDASNETKGGHSYIKHKDGKEYRLVSAVQEADYRSFSRGHLISTPTGSRFIEARERASYTSGGIFRRGGERDLQTLGASRFYPYGSRKYVEKYLVRKSEPIILGEGKSPDEYVKVTNEFKKVCPAYFEDLLREPTIKGGKACCPRCPRKFEIRNSVCENCFYQMPIKILLEDKLRKVKKDLTSSVNSLRNKQTRLKNIAEKEVDYTSELQKQSIAIFDLNKRIPMQKDFIVCLENALRDFRGWMENTPMYINVNKTYSNSSGMDRVLFFDGKILLQRKCNMPGDVPIVKYAFGSHAQEMETEQTVVYAQDYKGYYKHKRGITHKAFDRLAITGLPKTDFPFGCGVFRKEDRQKKIKLAINKVEIQHTDHMGYVSWLRYTGDIVASDMRKLESANGKAIQLKLYGRTDRFRLVSRVRTRAFPGQLEHIYVSLNQNGNYEYYIYPRKDADRVKWVISKMENGKETVLFHNTLFIENGRSAAFPNGYTNSAHYDALQKMIKGEYVTVTSEHSQRRECNYVSRTDQTWARKQTERMKRNAQGFRHWISHGMRSPDGDHYRLEPHRQCWMSGNEAVEMKHELKKW